MEGDIALEGLGLSTADRDMLIEETSVIFHIAALVKFDSTLKDAVLSNVRSTRDICDLGERMKHLVVSRFDYLKVCVCARARASIFMCARKKEKYNLRFSLCFGKIPIIYLLVFIVYLILSLQGSSAC